MYEQYSADGRPAKVLDEQGATGSSRGSVRWEVGVVRRRLAELLVAVGEGDRDAFTAFYRQTSYRVFGMALRMIGNRSTAEDIAQEVYLQVWSFAGRYDEGLASPVGWLMMLTHRRIVDRIRVEHAAVGRESVYGRLHAGRDHDEVLETVEQSFEKREVLHCLDKLTVLQRESIVLAYYGGLTYPQVAARLGAPLATVKGRIREGLKRLAAGLAENDLQYAALAAGRH